MNEQIEKLAGKIAEKVTLIRHDIHQHPETAYKETRTSKTIRAFLDEIGVASKVYGGTGVAAVIGSGDGHVVALRSEMDALPTKDLAGLPYSSVNDGVAHACGHDGHIAILLGTAWVLKQIENELNGKVKLIWQPAEEGGAGAQKMIDDGVLESPAPEAIFALHGWPKLEVGKAGYRFGPAMASTDNFEIIVKGKSTHGAMPHSGVDPIPISARIVDGIQHIHSRMLNPLVPSVITIGTIHGGTTENIIPDHVTMTGTIRAIDPDTRNTIPPLMERMVSDTATAAGGEAEFRIIAGYPPTINEKKATAFARDTLAEILGEDQLYEGQNPVMGGEDFAYYLKIIPGTFLRLGVGDTAQLHNSMYNFNDDAIIFGIRIMAGLADKFLKKGLK
ncbi:M20 family metallopeptidase [Candidatus Latescibacterota bacterium]